MSNIAQVAGRNKRQPEPAERITLLGSLQREWLRLPLTIMQDCGPATQTLAGLLAITRRETYAAAEKISRHARLPLPTVRKHLTTLAAAGWIMDRGRRHTRTGHPRRTCTITLPERTRQAMQPYGVLPWWATAKVPVHGRMPWATRAVLSLVMARLMSHAAAAERESNSTDELDKAAWIEEYLGDDARWRFSLAWIERNTGLARHSCIAAKQDLKRRGIVDWFGDGETADHLPPRWRFCVEVRPAGEGRVCVQYGSL